MSLSPTLADEMFLRQAIGLAMRGRGAVEPNPMVGCLLVRDGAVIGEGYHARFGGPHAEPAALAAASQPVAGATAYVTLEPCCHLDKKTPPCVPQLIAAGIARVVVGCLDPHPAVNGRGLSQLRDANISVDAPLLESDCKQLLAPFISRVKYGGPYVTLKWAESADGFVAGPHGQRRQISGERSMRAVHDLRARCDAIIIGSGTLTHDDPLLLARRVDLHRTARRVLLDTHLQLRPHHQLAQTARTAPVLVYAAQSAINVQPEIALALRQAGVEIIGVADEGIRIRQVMADLGRRGCTHVLVEAGPRLAQSCFDDGYVDRVWVFRSAASLNEPSAPRAAAVPYPATATCQLDSDTLTEYLNPASPVFFTNASSADFVRAAAGA